MKRFVVLFLACAAGLTSFVDVARAGQCGVPSARPLWIDVAGGTWWKRVFGRRGVVLAVGSISTTNPGQDVPSQARAAGATTVYWDNYLARRVGTPTRPTDPATIVERANRLVDYAARSTGCRTPLIGENELNGASLPTPWSPSNAQYRQNVLVFLRALAARGARPFLAISSPPYTGGEAGDWWREVAKVADIVREVYFPAPAVYRQGAILGNRSLRNMFRQAVTQLTSIGISPARVGLMLGFQTTRGNGGREGLRPAQAWFEVVKWQALAARQVAAELRIGSVWSWGWGAWRTTPGEHDPDKAAAACVYLWARSRLCNGPAAAGRGFNASLTEGQLRLPRGVRCTIGKERITTSEIRRLAGLTRDNEVAFTMLFARAAAQRRAKVGRRDLAAAERAVIALNFAGRRGAYRAALRRAGVSRSLALSLIGDELRQAKIEARLRVGGPSAAAVGEYYETYGEVPARLVNAVPAPKWLAGRKRGLAISSFAPPQLFTPSSPRTIRVRTIDAVHKVRVLGRPMPLRSFPLATARTTIRAALVEIARDEAFTTWMLRAQTSLLRGAICLRDELPVAAAISPTSYLPFLAVEP